MGSFQKSFKSLLSRKSSHQMEEEMKALRRNVVVTDHKVELSELLQRFEVNANVGLSTEEAKERLKEYGQNMLTPPSQTPAWIKFVRELTGFFSLLLWGGAILCFVGYSIDHSKDHLFLGIVLVFVVVVTGIFSYVQNSKSESLMNSFKNMLPPKVKVIRDGCSDEVVALNLVPGDIVFVEGGDLIPADVRVIECSDNFNVDNAALTGESEPQKRKPICTHEDPLETQNLCFFGTQVPEGSCKGIVISTGDKTVMGRIAALAMSTSNEQTPINREIHHFILIISAIAISLGVIFFLLNVYIGTPHIENLVFMIGIIVANVPEGLLATVTVCLTLTAKRMHEKKVLVKNLEGVETLGSTSCICSDKTGTLTQNIMTVARVVYGNSVACITEDAPSSFTAGNKSYDESNISFQKLSRCATLCNVATFNESSKWEVEEDGETKKLDSEGKAIPRPFSGHVVQGDGSKLETVFWKPVGNASECAMIKLVQSEANMTTGEGDVEKTRLNYPTKFVIPFNSKNKYQVHIHEEANTKKHLVMMKGAPERILNRCSHVMLNGKVVQMTEEERKNIESRQESLSAEGLRCLGFAELELDQNTYNQDCKYATDDDEYYSPNFPLGDVESKEVDSEGRQQNPKSIGGLVFLGLMALVDPPRPAVPAAVEKCKTAGVKVIMVTGDHPVTAQAIAYKVGILWSKTRGDMENDNNKFGRTPGSPNYEDPNDAQAIVVPGHTISVDMSEERWDFILNHPQIVFARTSPQQKLVIVENCQRLGHIVAVTGDGVNDSPAIKKADIGIAMGIMGSEVSKNAADMILLDDNFASIVKGVEEGRLIFDNLKKSIAYTIQSNIPEITPFLAFILFAIPLPLTTFLILAIDLGTDMIPAISMAYEYPEADIMKRPPRNSKTDRLVTKGMINFSYGQIGMIQAFAGFFTYMVVLNDYGYAPHVLPFRGNNDAWGHQPLFCKFSGGNYMNIKGEVDASRNPGEDAPSRQYPFWSEGLNGKVDSCYYAGNNYSGDAALRKDFDFRDSTTYVDGTKGHRTPTLEAIEANESQGYFEYVPWKGKKSSFWNDKFLYWNTDDANIAQSIGEDIDSAVYFRSAPAGLWSLCAHEDDKCSNSFCAEDGNAKVRGIATPDYADVKPSSDFQFSSCDDQAEMTNKKYKHAQFCNGQSDDDASCKKINGYEYDSKDNIISAFPTNRYQTFYCMGYNKVDDNACGPLTDSKDDLPFCYENGDRCGTFADHSKDGCAYMCEDHCYWPGSDAINPMTQQESKVSPVKWGSDVDKREYKQCKNIASNEVAWESLKHAQGAFFSSIVVGQIAGLLVCKTRWLSITVQGMKNNFMLFGIGTEILLVAWLAYCKPLNDALGTRNIRLVHWFCAIPFAILIFVFDEGRKALMRATSYEKLDPTTGQVTRVKGWLESNCAF